MTSMHHARGTLDQATAEHFPLFLRRVVATTAPAAIYEHNWHIDAIGAHLDACARGDMRRLIINMPPRMLKSTIVSVAWPAWLLGKDPRSKIMVASYAQSLSTKHSTDCRLVIQRPWYGRAFPETRLSRDQNEKEKFVTTARGQRFAVSVGGAAIGEGGNILIADDPLNPLQAMQSSSRDAAKAWFEHSFATRLDDKLRGAIVVVMQRLHADDLCGYLMQKGDWELLSLPAIAPQRTWIRCGDFQHERQAGEALHAAREPLDLLERLHREIGSANFAAQYQQAPVRQHGTIVQREWLAHRYDQPGEGLTVQSWDTAIKAGDGHDASACLTFMGGEDGHALVDALEVRLEYPELKRRIVSQAERYKPHAILIEDKASGQSLLQDLRRETTLPVIAQLPKGDKLHRLAQVTPLLEAGRLRLPRDAAWLADFERQLLGFPHDAHDDMVDALSQYLNWIRARDCTLQPTIRRL